MTNTNKKTIHQQKAIVYRSQCQEGIDLETRPLSWKNHTEHLKKGHLFIRVYYASVNPVDAKYNVGDKLPLFLGNVGRKFGRWINEGNIAGFDFVGAGCTLLCHWLTDNNQRRQTQ